jgi:hypothetical protein
LIPASGLLLSQEAAAGCTCSYPIRCSFAMIRKPQRQQPWTVFVTGGDTKPVKHFAINFGATADMKDDDNVVWFGYPNPKTTTHTHFPNYGVKFDLNEKINPGKGFFNRDSRGVEIEGTDKPWLYTSGCRGLTYCQIPLIDKSSEPASYTVRLGFMHSKRNMSFDIILQGKTMEKDFSPEEKAVVKEYKNISIEENLVLEFAAEEGQNSVINFIEIIRQ